MERFEAIASVQLTLVLTSHRPFVSQAFDIFLWQDDVKRTGETGVEETILEGHLGVTKELLAFQTPEKKYHIGCEKGGANLIKVSSVGLVLSYVSLTFYMFISKSVWLIYGIMSWVCFLDHFSFLLLKNIEVTVTFKIVSKFCT